MILVDTSVIIDVLQRDPQWVHASLRAMELAAGQDELAINDIIYAEMSTRYKTATEIDAAVAALELRHPTMPRMALFEAGKAFERYRRRGGTKTSVLPDFFIGAHAAVQDWPLLTRDAGRVRSYFPTVPIFTP